MKTSKRIINMGKIIVDNMIITGTDLKMTRVNSEENNPKLRKVDPSEISDTKSVLLCKNDDGYVPCTVVSVHPEDAKILVNFNGTMKLVCDNEIWTVL